jgi:hypothetical protein
MKMNSKRRMMLGIGSLLAIAVASALAGTAARAASLEESAQSLPNLFALPDPAGFVETYNINNTAIDLTGPFFLSLGTNGRSCSSRHRPAEAWSVSAAEVAMHSGKLGFAFHHSEVIAFQVVVCKVAVHRYVVGLRQKILRKFWGAQKRVWAATDEHLYVQPAATEQ